MSKTKTVEYVVALDNLFSVPMEMPVDEDGDVDYTEAAEIAMEVKALGIIQVAVAEMISCHRTHLSNLRPKDGVMMQIEVIDVNEDYEGGSA